MQAVARHYSRHHGYASKENDQKSLPLRAYHLARGERC